VDGHKSNKMVNVTSSFRSCPGQRKRKGVRILLFVGQAEDKMSGRPVSKRNIFMKMEENGDIK
jgi:hypothetical protein